ncbi:MAG TPA: DUF3800 domain-containing protein [Terracidiphilus sp.]|nr:DUF3800 domain-containing protein [Terracidiphilus sp.]
MFLAYLDDTGSDRESPFQVMTAVLVPDGFFHAAQSRIVGGLAAYIPEDKAEEFWQKFDEFKGWQLFGGYGPFEGIEQAVRDGIIEYLLELMNDFRLPIVYGAVDREKMRAQIWGTANPVDVCFRLCMDGIVGQMKGELTDGFALLIADNSTKDWKNMRDSFREFRSRMARPGREPFPTPYIHDDMYFGDSKFSIGIQLADLCGYFIAKHLEGNARAEGFYGLIKDRIVYSRVEP